MDFIVIILVITGYYFFLNLMNKSIFYFFVLFIRLRVSSVQVVVHKEFHEILHLNFKEAFLQNALVLIAIPYFSLIFFTSFFKKNLLLRQFLIGKKTILILFFIVILFGILEIYKNFIHLHSRKRVLKAEIIPKEHRTGNAVYGNVFDVFFTRGILLFDLFNFYNIRMKGFIILGLGMSSVLSAQIDTVQKKKFKRLALRKGCRFPKKLLTYKKI